MYGEEDKFIASKIIPNVPSDQKVATLNCTGISKLQQWDQSNQTAFIGFYGSGNHMMW